MIARDYITQWSTAAPWPTDQQVEQDLILSRLIVEIASHPLLSQELAFRGGTCLHKLHLDQALRYSEDLDYVRTTTSGAGPLIDALREITTSVGLEEKGRQLGGQMIQFLSTAPAEGGGELRIKIEINIGESELLKDDRVETFEVQSAWFNGSADVCTFGIEELMATKLRALYQRRKGRDLFDLWHVLEDLEVDDEKIVKALKRYMRAETFTFPELRANLNAKLRHPDFRDDLGTLVVDEPDDYDMEQASDLVLHRLGRYLRNASSAEHQSAGTK